MKVEELQQIQKILRLLYPLALELFDPGDSDAPLLTGMITADAQMTRKDSQHWLKTAGPPIAH